MTCASRGRMMMEEPARNPPNVGVNARGSHTVNHGYLPGHTAVDALFKDKMNANTKHYPSGMYFQNWGKEEFGPKTLCSSNMESDSRLETDVDGVWAILNSLKNFDIEDAVMVVKYSKKGTKVRIVRGQTDDFMLDTLGKESMMPFTTDGSTSNPLFYDALATNSVEGVRSTTDLMTPGRTQQGTNQINRGSGHNQDNSFGLQVSFDQSGSEQRTNSGGFEQESKPPRANDSGKLAEDKPNVTGNISPTHGKSFSACSDLVQQTDTRIEGNEFELECKACGKLFSDSFYLDIHCKMHTGRWQNASLTKESPSDCLPSPMGAKTFSNESSLQRDASEEICEKPLNCSTSRIALMDASLLSSNTNTHPEMKAFQCLKCEKAFPTKIAQKRHMSRNLKVTLCRCEEGTLNRSRRITATHTDGPSFKCPTCGVVFDERSSLESHRKSHKEESVQESPRNQNKCVCTTCGKAMTSRADLQTHSKTCTKQKSYECKKCGKVLTSKADLRSHRKTHKRQKSFECETCGKVFSNCRYFRKHRITHLGLRPFGCSTCGKVYSTKAHLKVHTRIHTGEKPYVCSVCGKGFAQASGRKRHEKGIHFIEKPYACPTCDISFKKVVSLRNHIKKIHKQKRKKTMMTNQ